MECEYEDWEGEGGDVRDAMPVSLLAGQTKLSNIGDTLFATSACSIFFDSICAKIVSRWSSWIIRVKFPAEARVFVFTTVSIAVKALYYKPEGRGFETR
jgi:hypothetical protein